MNVLLEREDLRLVVVTQDEALPECLRSYQPLVMLYSEKGPRQDGGEMEWRFSENYQGITSADYAMHDVPTPTRDYDGSVIGFDCNF